MSLESFICPHCGCKLPESWADSHQDVCEMIEEEEEE